MIYWRNKHEFENLFKDCILENRESYAKKCGLQNYDDIALENAVHYKCLYHFGNGVEKFLDKKGYSWKRLRGSKVYTPESDLDKISIISMK